MAEQAFTWTKRAEQSWLDAMSADLHLDAIPRQVAEADPVVPQSPIGSYLNGALDVRKVGYYMPITEEQLRWAEEDRKAAEEAEERWNAMTPAERETARAEWQERRAREKAERTCEHCGCDPDEHGGY